MNLIECIPALATLDIGKGRGGEGRVQERDATGGEGERRGGKERLLLRLLKKGLKL